MQRKHPKHARRSYLSVGIGGDSQSLLEREPLQSKDRGLLSYNIDYIENDTQKGFINTPTQQTFRADDAVTKKINSFF